MACGVLLVTDMAIIMVIDVVTMPVHGQAIMQDEEILLVTIFIITGQVELPEQVYQQMTEGEICKDQQHLIVPQVIVQHNPQTERTMFTPIEVEMFIGRMVTTGKRVREAGGRMHHHQQEDHPRQEKQIGQHQ